MSRLRRFLGLAGAAALGLAPRLAAACAMCNAGASNAETQHAFVVGSIFMSVTPPLAIGTIAFVVVRRARRIAAEESAEAVGLAERRPAAARIPSAAALPFPERRVPTA